MLSSRPAASLDELLRKSSYPSPPLITNIRVAMVSICSDTDARRDRCDVAVGEVAPVAPKSIALEGLLLEEEGISTLVRNRTWPVWPWTRPVTVGWVRLFRVVPADTLGMTRVSTTPALVPIHSRSLQVSNAVMRRHAVLCWRMISSAAAKGEKYKL